MSVIDVPRNSIVESCIDPDNVVENANPNLENLIENSDEDEKPTLLR